VRAVFLDYETVSNGDLDTSGLTRVIPELLFFGSTDDAQIAGRIDDAEIVLLNKSALTRDRLFAAKRLKLIALAATGTDNVDLAAARERGLLAVSFDVEGARSLGERLEQIMGARS